MKKIYFLIFIFFIAWPCLAFEFGGGGYLNQLNKDTASGILNLINKTEQRLGNGLTGSPHHWEITFKTKYFFGEHAFVTIGLVPFSLSNYTSTSTNCNGSSTLAAETFYEGSDYTSNATTTKTFSFSDHPNYFVLKTECFYSLRVYGAGNGSQGFVMGASFDNFSGGLFYSDDNPEILADMYFKTLTGASGEWSGGESWGTSTLPFSDPDTYYPEHGTLYTSLVDTAKTILIPVGQILINYTNALSASSADALASTTAYSLNAILGYGQGINQIANFPIFQILIAVTFLLIAAIIFKGAWYLLKLLR